MNVMNNYSLFVLKHTSSKHLYFIQRGLELKAELNLSPIRLNVTQLKNRPCSKSIKAQLGKHHIEPYTIEK